MRNRVLRKDLHIKTRRIPFTVNYPNQAATDKSAGYLNASTIDISARGKTFHTQWVLVAGSTKETLFGNFINVFPIKSIVGKPEWTDQYAMGTNPNITRDTPWWMVIGPSITGLINEFPRKRN